MLPLQKPRSKRIARLVRGKPFLSPARPLDLSPGDVLLFGDATRAHGGEAPIEKIGKIKDPLMHPSETGAKLMDAVSQVVGFRPRQVMSQVPEAFQASHALDLSLRGKMIKALIGWRCAVIFPVKFHFRRSYLFN